MKYYLERKKLFITLILLFIGASVFVYAYSTGITGVTRKNGHGCTCHNPTPSSQVKVTIIGPDTLSLNQTADFKVTISGGPLIRAGTDIAVSSGILAPDGTDLRLDPSDGELTHTLPKAPTGGTVTFNFLYTAPSVSKTIIIYAAGNSVNFNGINDSGDMWNFAPNKNVVISAVAGININQVPFNYNLEQNYPNPFNPTTTIRYSIPGIQYVSIKVFDILGRDVATLVSGLQTRGLHSVKFDGSKLPGGIYLYRMRAGNFAETKKLILLK